MPARGARTTAVASRTAAILHSRNAGLPCEALVDSADLTRSPAPPTAPPPAPGMVPTSPGAPGALISETARIGTAAAQSCAATWDAIEAPAKQAQNIRRGVATPLEC